MRFSIEIEDSKFIDVDFEDILYFSGYNQKKLWKIYRSFYFYFHKEAKLSENIYGDNGIELKLDDEILSQKHNQAYFINSRESIYEQMMYKKGAMLFDILNLETNNIEIINSLELINDELIKIGINLQDKVNIFADSLNIDFQDFNLLELLKNNLNVGYTETGKNFPLDYMSTDELIDEYLKFLEVKLKNTADTIWLVLYNLNSYLSKERQFEFIKTIKNYVKKYNLKVIYIGNDLQNINFDIDDIERTVVVADEYEQLLPYSQFKQTISSHYPCELKTSDEMLVRRVQIIIPFIGLKKINILSNKNLVLLKVVNQILGYKTLFNISEEELTSAETEFLIN